MAKYLTRLGWGVTVVTPHFTYWREVDDVAETEARLQQEGIHRILTGHRWRCLAPDTLRWKNRGFAWLAGGVCRKVIRRFGIDAGVGWINSAERACSSLTAKDVDVILATGSPYAAFSLARRLAKRLGRPYVLDYRDPWTGNPHAIGQDQAATIRVEASLIAGAMAVTIVSPSWAEAMNRGFGPGSKLHVVTNGYDPEELEDIKPHNFGHFAIVYAGSFYPPKRVITPVMAVLQRLAKGKTVSSIKWLFHYYGKEQGHVREEAIRHGIMDRVVMHGSVPRGEILSAIRGAGVAVVITSVNDGMQSQDKGIVPGKMFEILGLDTPSLVIAPPQSDIATIAETTGLAHRCTGEETEKAAAYLASVMHGWKPAAAGRECYAWPNIVTSLEPILRLCERPAPASSIRAI